jgi:hypothetical protein
VTNQNSKSETGQRRFSQEQYDMLKRCSDKKDISEWNEWRKNNKEDICLEGANFNKSYLNGALLDENPIKYSGKVYLRGAKFRCAELVGAEFMKSHLEQADFYHANMQDTYLGLTHLEGADFSYSDLEGANLPFCTTDNGTIFLYCKINRRTWFQGVGLDSVRIDPANKPLLEYNIRRSRWCEWYKEHKILKWPVWLFWLMSDYGLSTRWIIFTFLVLAILFAAIYYICGWITSPGIVDYLFVDGNGVKIAWWLVPIRAIHFSIVIMTVGFTNMHANAHSFWAHILVSFQMILGFVLLGALVTRFAVLFTTGGPAGKFTDEKTIWQRLKERWNKIEKKD